MKFHLSNAPAGNKPCEGKYGEKLSGIDVMALFEMVEVLMIIDDITEK